MPFHLLTRTSVCYIPWDSLGFSFSSSNHRLFVVSCILLYMGFGVGGLDRFTKLSPPSNERVRLSEFEERIVWFACLFDGFHASFQDYPALVLLPLDGQVLSSKYPLMPNTADLRLRAQFVCLLSSRRNGN